MFDIVCVDYRDGVYFGYLKGSDKYKKHLLESGFIDNYLDVGVYTCGGFNWLKGGGRSNNSCVMVLKSGSGAREFVVLDGDSVMSCSGLVSGCRVRLLRPLPFEREKRESLPEFHCVSFSEEDFRERGVYIPVAYLRGTVAYKNYFPQDLIRPGEKWIFCGRYQVEHIRERKDLSCIVFMVSLDSDTDKTLLVRSSSNVLFWMGVAEGSEVYVFEVRPLV